MNETFSETFLGLGSVNQKHTGCKGEKLFTTLQTADNAVEVTLLSSFSFLNKLKTETPSPLSTILVRITATPRVNTRTHWHAAYRTPTRLSEREAWMTGMRCGLSATSCRISFSKRHIVAIAVSAA
jgi:hypothetical protein